jgi:hypothetical protein
LRQGKVNKPTKDAHPPPKTPHVTPSTFYHVGGGVTELPSERVDNKKELFNDTPCARHYPTKAATSCCGSSPRFYGDIRNVIIEVPSFAIALLHWEEAAYLSALISNKINQCMVTALRPPQPPPTNLITPPLARGHLLING